MKPRQFRKFMCDFETTVFEGQLYTEVWAAAAVELFTEDVKIFHSIDELYEYFLSLDDTRYQFRIVPIKRPIAVQTSPVPER